MTKKKSRLIVETYGPEGRNPYDLHRPAFSLVSSPKNGRRQCTRLLTCRDYQHEAVRAYVHSNNRLSYYHRVGEDAPMDMEKLRLLIARDFDTKEDAETFRKNLFGAKRIINFYEEVAGWAKSKITTVTYPKYAWLLTGPKEWMSYPNLLSMVTLILRVISNHGPVEFKNNITLEREYKRIITEYDEAEKPRGGYARGQGHDLTYLEECHRKFYLIAKHNKELFTLPLKEAYPPEGTAEGAAFHRCGGIVQLCKFEAASRELNEKFKELWEKYNAVRAEKEEMDVQKEFHDRHGS